MPWALSLFPALFLLSGGLAIAIGIVAIQRRPDPMAWPLAILMVGVAAWVIPQAISLGYTELEPIVRWHRLRYPGIAVAPVAYFVLALQYAGHERWLNRGTYAGLSIVPIGSTLSVWTNPTHGLHWQSLSVVRTGDVSVVVETFGPLGSINLGLLYLLTAASLIVLGTQVIRSDPVYRKQALALFLGGLIPLAANVATDIGLGPGTGIDLTAVAVVLTGLTVALALFHFDLLDIRPIARDRLVDELEDGVVVTGPDGRVRDFNPLAARILDGLAIDRSGEEVLPTDADPDHGDLVVETREGKRWYRARATTLADGRNHQIGEIVLLDDISELVEREQRITVLNRILRHNIRNELNKVAGRLDQLRAAGPDEAVEEIDRAEASLDRMIEFAEKARHIERTLGREDTGSVVSATQLVKEVVDEARNTYEAAEIQCRLDEAPIKVLPIRVVDSDLVRTAISELIENGIEHNDRDKPTVAVNVQPDGEYVHVRVADDGPGIPEPEQDVLSSRTETGLSHSSGLGLWLVEWAASLSSGECSISENDPRGTVVTLSFPAAEE